MERNRRYFSGQTLQQALMRAASHYGCEPEQLVWKEVEKRHGFLKVRRGVIVEIDPESPVRTASTPAVEPEPRRPVAAESAADEPPAPSVEAPEPDRGAPEPGREGEGEDVDRPWWVMPPAPAAEEAGSPEAARPAVGGEGEPRRRRRGPRPRRRRPEHREEAARSVPGEEITTLREAPATPSERWTRAEGEVAECARRWTGELLELAGLELDVDVFDAGEEVLVELTGRHRELAIADRGRVLFAIQHLLPRLMRADLGETPSVRVDSESFQDLREETLRDLAQRAADRVRENRRPWLLEPMAPDERRIVHLTLADDPAVTTESQGEGYFKRVRVQLERRRGR